METCEFRQYIKHISCRPYKLFTVDMENGKGTIVYIENTVPDSITHLPIHVHNRRAFSTETIEHITKDELLHVIRYIIRDMTIHEIDEQFHYNDKQIFNPHPSKKES